MMSERFKGEQGDTLTVSEWIVHPVDGSQPILIEWERHRTRRPASSITLAVALRLSQRSPGAWFSGGETTLVGVQAA
jgi:hypothetical protein